MKRDRDAYSSETRKRTKRVRGIIDHPHPHANQTKHRETISAGMSFPNNTSLQSSNSIQPIPITVNLSAATIVEGPVTIQVKVGAVNVAATIDTGAGISIIQLALAREFPKISQKKYFLQGLNGKPLTNSGFAIVALTIGNYLIKYPMMIVKNSSFSVLLGYEFLESYRCQLDATLTSAVFGTIPFSSARRDILGTLPQDVKINLDVKDTQPFQIKVKEMPSVDLTCTSTLQGTDGDLTAVPILRQSPHLSRNYLRLSETITIPPRTKQSVPVMPDRPIDKGIGIVSRNDKMYVKNRILVPNFLIDSETGFVEIINSGNISTILAKGTRLGKIDRYDNIPIPLLQTTFGPEVEIEANSDLSSLHINPEITPSTVDSLKELIKKYSCLFQWDPKKGIGQTKRVTYASSSSLIQKKSTR
jgi:hypothetical protein